jgi:predicted dienelactone hydrolase
MLASLLVAWAAPLAPLRAAELLEVRLEGLALPLNLRQLQVWARQPQDRSAVNALAEADLLVWLNLLSPVTQRDLRQLLNTPLLRERSFGRQLLDSWAGRQVLEEVGQLLTRADGSPTTDQLQSTLQRLLSERRDVTAIDLLRELPEERLSLQLDTVLVTAGQWRQQLALQSQALQGLQNLGLPVQPADGAWLRSQPSYPLEAGVPSRVSLAARRPVSWRTVAIEGQKLSFKVPHRIQPLPLVVWRALNGTGPATGSATGPALAPATGPASATGPVNAASPSLPWVLLLPGLGGDIDQLSWLAEGLARRGWSVLALQHPGSDAAALREALQGQRPPPGGESLALRLADIDAVLQAQRLGRLPVSGDGLVLMGHSLGAVTALLAGGLLPEPGLEPRCRATLTRLPFTNPSRLLQCQLPPSVRNRGLIGPGELRAVVGFNPFGSLIWPRRGLSGLSVPLLLGGGSLDLVTPPLEEQLGLFPPDVNPRSRLVLVQGGSHFSPIHVADGNSALFRLGDELVGVAPLVVQELLLQLTSEFLSGLALPNLALPHQPSPPPPQRRSRAGVTAFVLDPQAAQRWRRELHP